MRRPVLRAARAALRSPALVTFTALAALTLAACGTRGPLTLPPPQAETPAKPPAQPARTATPPAADLSTAKEAAR